MRLRAGDARALIEALPPASLSRIFILYPDPWPKRRHHKRRVISAEMIGQIARAARPGAILRFATDIDDYAGWALSRFLDSARFPLDGARRRRLADSLGRLVGDALRSQGARRRPRIGVFDVHSPMKGRAKAGLWAIR